MNPKVDFYFTKPGKWQQEVVLLRGIILDCHLTEELKWGCPCYTYQSGNVVLIHTFKEYCAVLFPKGALLKDPQGILIQQTANVQAARQVRFTKVDDVVRLTDALKACIYEAVEIEESGAKVPLKKVSEFSMAAEFQQKLDENAALKTAFYALTPGRQRAYLLHFSQPKQAATRHSRVGKCIPLILSGKGLNDD